MTNEVETADTTPGGEQTDSGWGTEVQMDRRVTSCFCNYG